MDIRRSNLKHEVRGYADKLYADIQDIYGKYGVKNVKELHSAMAEGRIKVSKTEVQRLKRLIDQLDQTLKRNELPGLTELAKVGENGNFVVSNGKVFIEDCYTENEVDIDFQGTHQVVIFTVSCLQDPSMEIEGTSSLRYVIGDGQLFLIDDNNQIMDAHHTPIGVEAVSHLHNFAISDGIWYAFTDNEEGGEDVYELEKGDDWSNWSRIYGGPEQDEHEHDLDDFRLDQGKLYARNIFEDGPEDSPDSYRCTIKNIHTNEVIYDGLWDKTTGWRMSDGVLYLKKKSADGRITFLKNGEPFYEYFGGELLYDWRIDKGVLYLIQKSGDWDKTLYRVEPEEAERTTI